MRVDGGSTSNKPVNPYAAAAEKATSARRAFQMRKKLAKRSAGTQNWSGLGRASMIDQWMNAGRSQAQIKGQTHPRVPGKD